MFEQAKNMMDNAMSHNDALSQIENQRSGRQTHTTRNIVIGVAVLAVIVLAIILF